MGFLGAAAEAAFRVAVGNASHGSRDESREAHIEMSRAKRAFRFGCEFVCYLILNSQPSNPRNAPDESLIGAKRSDGSRGLAS